MGDWTMELSKNCRLYALQCFRWAASIKDASQHLIFTDVARDWLAAAEEIERSPDTARETILARLH
jgi:hypothetical protein